MNFELSGLEPTKNNFGYMHPKSFLMNEFISFSKNVSQPVLDIGSAYGVATIQCLKEGAQVISCDICNDHLTLLVDRTPVELRKNLKIMNLRFPYETKFLDNSLSAVFLSHVLSFLEIEEIEFGIKKIYDWLEVSGKIFILNYTPYYKTLKNFIPIYQERIAEDIKWPGFIEDKRKFIDKIRSSDNVPNRLNLMDIPILKELAEKNGFKINMLKYFGGVEAGVPEPFCLDGREWVGMIATK